MLPDFLVFDKELCHKISIILYITRPSSRQQGDTSAEQAITTADNH